MKKLLRLVLIYAGLFLIHAAVPILLLYLELESNRVHSMFPDTPVASQVQDIETMQDPDGLRRLCRDLAIQADHFSEFLQWDRHTSRQLTWGWIGTLLLWNGIAVGAFLHVAWEIRKLLRVGASGATHAL